MELNFDCWYKDVCTVDKSNCASCIRYKEMKYLIDNSGIPKSRQKPVSLRASDCDFDNFLLLADIKADILNFVDRGQSLYICSHNTGNGKTTWAIKILLKYFDSVWAGNGFRPRGLFIHTPTFLLKCKEFNNRDPEFEQIKQNAQTADLVVWDDIGSMGLSNYDYSQLLMYIDIRNSNNLSNIYTSNITTSEELEKALSSKLASRILTRNTIQITLNGGDMR